VIERLHIRPAPSPDEAAAIAAALQQLIQGHGLGQAASPSAGLRYQDVVADRTSEPQRRLRWIDAARLESLDV